MSSYLYIKRLATKVSKALESVDTSISNSTTYSDAVPSTRGSARA